MISAAQAAANAANAQRSTGPRTEPGKARSSQNARTHGLTARDAVVLPGEREDFDALRDELLAELRPYGVIEMLTFNQLLHAAWNLRRIRRLEADLAAGGADPLLDASAARTLDRLNLYAIRAERSYYRAIRELRTLQTECASRAAKLTLQEQTHVPLLASINEAMKRTQGGLTNEAVKLALDLVHYEPRPLDRRNRRSPKPNPAPDPPSSAAAAG